MGVFAAERQTFPDQMGDAKAQRGVQTLDVLGAADDVQRAQNDRFVGRQRVGMTAGGQVGRGEAVPQSPGPFQVALPDETADDLAGEPVHRQPDPLPIRMVSHKGAYFVALQHQRRGCWSAQPFFETTSAGSMLCGTVSTRF